MVQQPQVRHHADVRESEVTDTSTVPEIGWKYKHLRPKTTLPLDEASEPEVEDESPLSNTTGMESDNEKSSGEEDNPGKKPSADEKDSTPTAKDSNAHLSDEAEESEDEEAKLPSGGEDPEDDAVVPPAKRPGGLIVDFRDTMKGIAESVTERAPRNPRMFHLQNQLQSPRNDLVYAPRLTACPQMKPQLPTKALRPTL